MWPGKAKSAAAQGLVEAGLHGGLTEKPARRLTNENPKALALALLAASKRIADALKPTRLRRHSRRYPSRPLQMVVLLD